MIIAPPVNSVSSRTPSTTAQRTMAAIRQAEMVRKRLRRETKLMGFFSAGAFLSAPYSHGLRSALMDAAPRIITRVANTPNTKLSRTPVSSV